MENNDSYIKGFNKGYASSKRRTLETIKTIIDEGIEIYPRNKYWNIIDHINRVLASDLKNNE